MIQRFKNSRFKIVGNVFFAGIILFFALMNNGCVQNDVKKKEINIDSACNSGISQAKREISNGKYLISENGIDKELKFYAEEIFLNYYGKEVSIREKDIIYVDFPPKEEVYHNKCYYNYMDSVVAAFGENVFKRVAAGADSLHKKFPYRYKEDFPNSQPTFPGGDSAMKSFLSKNIRYPASAKRDNIQGTVFVRIDVDENGNVTNAQVIKGVRKDLDSAACVGMMKLPKFIPLFSRGRNVPSSTVQPVKFVLK